MKRNIRLLALVAACLMLCLSPSRAGTSATVTGTVTINSGGLDISADGTNIAFPAVTLQGVDQTVTATTGPTFTIFDGTGANSGWNVTFSATDFTDTTGTIANTQFTFNPTGGTITRSGTGGQAVDGTGGPKETGGGAVDMSAARKVVTTAATFGKGKYTYAPLAGNFSLTVPATTLRGSGAFTSTLTATISSGP
jgi:hypothetical protein